MAFQISAFATSVWINDKFAGTVYSPEEGANKLFTFPDGSVLVGQDNVVTVLQDNMGLDEDDNVKSTRGIAGFDLVGGGNFTTWRVQGKLGGYKRCAELSLVRLATEDDC